MIRCEKEYLLHLIALYVLQPRRGRIAYGKSEIPQTPSDTEKDRTQTANGRFDAPRRSAGVEGTVSRCHLCQQIGVYSLAAWANKRQIADTAFYLVQKSIYMSTCRKKNKV